MVPSPPNTTTMLASLRSKLFERIYYGCSYYWYYSNILLMQELQENTIEQIRTLLRYLSETDLLKNKDILMCLDVIAREYGGEVVDKN